MATASLNGSSYLEFSVNDNVALTTVVTVRFQPNHPDGIIVYSGGDYVDFMSLVLVQSEIQFRFELGSGTEVLSGPTLSLGDWHTVIAMRTGQNGTLRVNGVDVTTTISQGTSTMLNIGTRLFVGGASGSSSVSPDVGIMDGFVGCVSDVQVNGESHTMYSSGPLYRKWPSVQEVVLCTGSGPL